MADDYRVPLMEQSETEPLTPTHRESFIVVFKPSDRESLVWKEIENLSEEFGGTFSRETVARHVYESLESLEGARVNDFIHIFVNRLARERLKRQDESGASMAEKW